MLFDIRTPDSAHAFIQEFLDISFRDFIHEYICECDRDIDKFWYKNIDKITQINIDNIEFIAMHVTSNYDDCFEIKTNGIKNLQSVLSDNTNFNSHLAKHGIRFDIENKLLFEGTQVIDINYTKYRSRHDLTSVEERIRRIAHKIYYDFQINAFFSNNKVEEYGTMIHRRPEFLFNLMQLFPNHKLVEDEWIEKCRGYIIVFKATYDQFAWFTFYNHAYESDDDSEDKLQIKKWILTKSIIRSFDHISDSSEVFAYLKPETIISPSQIIDNYLID